MIYPSKNPPIPEVQKLIDSIIPHYEEQDWDYYIPHILQVLEKALVLQPNCPEIYLYMGKTKQGNGHDAAARADFEKALELDPEYVQALLELATFYQDENWEKSLSIYQQIVKIQAECLLAWNNLIAWLKYKQDLDAVDEAVTALLAANPDKTEAYRIAANAYTARYIFEKPRDEKALEYFNKAIELAPDDKEGYYLRYFVNFRLQRYEEALADLNRQLALKTNTILTYYFIEVYKALKRFEEALAECNTWMKKGYDQNVPYWYRASVYKAMGEYDKALADLDIACKKTPNYDKDSKPRYYADKAEIYLLQGNIPDALASIHQAIDSSKYEYSKAAFSLLKVEILLAKDATEAKAFLKTVEKKYGKIFQNNLYFQEQLKKLNV